VANLCTATNWANVVDFRWHRSTQSPNWSVLPEEERAAYIEAAGWGIAGGAGGAGDDGDDDDDDDDEL
jgi:hypothetical protein